MKEKVQSPQEAIAEIRNMMERSSRFISLSGLSGVFAGLYAITGAFAAYWYLDLRALGYFSGARIASDRNSLLFLVADAFTVLVLAVGTGIFMTTRKARKDGNSIFDNTAKKLIINLIIPLVTGGIFCIALVVHHAYIFVPATMLVFYGIALVHASSFTRNDIKQLGIAEIAVGICALFTLGYGLLFWTIGFGVLHVIYGAYMYYKYEV